jgi:hypothetical protein
MTIKIKGERVAPPADRCWRKLNDGMSVEVAGLRYRRDIVAEFIQSAERAAPGGFGVTVRREPDNVHGANGNATAVDGWWMQRGFFGPKRQVRHLGYLPSWASHECLFGKTPEPAIHVDLYSCYLGHDGFVDVDIIVYVERTAAEVREVESARAIREARKHCLPGLKVLARIAAADGRVGDTGEITIMRDYIANRVSRLGISISSEVIEQIVEAAAGLPPSDQAVLAAVRTMANDDLALQDLFRSGLALARADGEESQGELDILRRILATARRKREKGSSTDK